MTLKTQIFDRCLKLLLLTVCTLCVNARGFAMGAHFIENHRDYPVNQGGQTWCISPYNDDWIFFANKNGVYQFDGNYWAVLSMNNAEDVRSVHADEKTNRVYLGGINEFGFVSPDEHGFLKYTCLSDSLGHEKFIGNIWGIYEHDGRIYAQGDHDILIFRDNKATVVRTHEKLNCSNLVNGVLCLGTEQGLKVLVGNNISPAYGSRELDKLRIRAIVPYKNGILAITDVSGVYFYDGKTTKRLSFDPTWESRMTDLFCGAVSGETLALGTILNGLFIVDLKSGAVQHYSQSSGMQDNTVLSLAFDSSYNLWAGLDSGIDCVRLSLPVTELFSHTSNIGAGYVAELDNDKLYCGTNRGLYVATKNGGSQPDVNLFGSLSGQVWDIKRIGADLFCMHDRGLLRIANGTTEQLDITDGAWRIEPFIGNPNRAYVGTYDGLRIIERDNTGHWHTIREIENCYVSAYSFTQEKSLCLWYVDPHTCVVRVTLDPKTLGVRSQKKYGAEQGLPTADDLNVSNIGGVICFSTSKGIYRYDAKTDKITPYEEMNKRLDGRTQIQRIESHGQYIFALTQKEMVRIGGGKTISLPITPLWAKSFHPSHLFTVLNDSTVIMPNHTGYSVYHFGGHIPELKLTQKYCRINRVSLTSTGDSLIFTANFLELKPNIEIPYSENCIKITYGAPSMGSVRIDGYRYRLNNGNWSELTDSNIKEYTNLSEGEYTFEVMAQLTTGQTVTDSITFKILPPWYRSMVAKIVYLLLLLFTLWLIYKLSNKRVAHATRKVAIAKDAELEQKDKEIHELEKQKLQSEIEQKSKEILNLLLSVSNKHEALLNIKEELLKVRANLKGDSANRRSLTALEEQIDTALQSEKILERIEKEFDLVNNDFTKKLRADFPDLTSNEIKMCSYIKMNLSTKEIAPLMNMSMRGVETIRYRMRKKFGLERSDSLTEFIRRR